MPADFKIETLDAYQALNEKFPVARVDSTYGNISIDNPFSSGRELQDIPTIDLNALAQYVKFSDERKINFYYTLNASFLQNTELTRSGSNKIIEFLQKLKDIGVKTLTIALPSLMELAITSRLGFKIKASVICQISTPNKALFFKKMGITGMVADETLNRNFSQLKAIRERFGEDVEIIVNSICHQDCQYRMFHYNQISKQASGEDDFSSKYYTNKCYARLFQDITNFFKLSWVRPEDLNFYEEIGVNRFKLQGRQAVLKGDPVRTVESYMAGKFIGNFNELLLMFSPESQKLPFSISNHSLSEFILPFINGNHICKNDCEKCKYCEKYAEKHIFNFQVMRESIAEKLNR